MTFDQCRQHRDSGFSISSSTISPSVRYTGRLVGDAAGTMGQGEATMVAGTGSQTGANLSRWGDYSSMNIDPIDDCTFWYTQEYMAASGSFNWHTRVGTFKFAELRRGRPTTSASRRTRRRRPSRPARARPTRSTPPSCRARAEHRSDGVRAARGRHRELQPDERDRGRQLDAHRDRGRRQPARARRSSRSPAPARRRPTPRTRRSRSPTTTSRRPSRSPHRPTARR